LIVNYPEVLVTACQLCKKTFNKNAPVPVKDIAEIVGDSLNRTTIGQKERTAMEGVVG
jgi:hypothetical protein